MSTKVKAFSAQLTFFVAALYSAFRLHSRNLERMNGGTGETLGLA